MNDENKLRKFVRFQLYRGRNLTDIFNDLFLEFTGKSPALTANELEKWYENFRSDPDKCVTSSSWNSEMAPYFKVFEEGSPALKSGEVARHFRRLVNKVPDHEFRTALRIICDEFKKVKRAYKSGICTGITNYYDRCKMIVLSERYAVDTETNSDGSKFFYLIDILHNEKRRLEMNGDLSRLTNSFNLVALNSDHFLCVTSYIPDTDNERRIYISLFQVNTAQMKCKFIDKHEFNGDYTQIIVDSADPCKFLLCSNDEDFKEYAQKGRITDDGKLEIGDEIFYTAIEIPCQNLWFHHDSYNYSDGKFYGSCRSHNGSEQFIFETILKEGEAQVLQLVRIYTDDDDEKANFENASFVWSGNVCYALKQRDNGITHIYKFDMETQRITKTEHRIFNEILCMKISNGIMVICTLSNEALQHTWYRIPLDQSDTLLNLSMERLRREVIFMDENEHTKFLQKLPTKLRPFCGHLANIEELDKPRCSRKRLLSGSSSGVCCVKK